MDTAYSAHPTRPPRPRGHRVPVGLRAPFAGRTWREFLHLCLSLPVASVMFGYAVAVVSTSAGLLITFLGIPVLAGGLAGARGLGALERARARALLGLDVAAPEPLRPSKPGLMAWVGAVLKSGASWRHLLYAFVHFPWALFAFVGSVTFWSVGWALLSFPFWYWLAPSYASLPGIQLWGDGTTVLYVSPTVAALVSGVFGLLMVLAGPWVFRGLTQVDRLLVRGLLGPSPLATRVIELESDRGVVVDTAAADLRRIERDLHDGAQARLVALAMDLGLAKEKLAADPQAAARMVDEAHGEVKVALQELRDLARGIHPAILTDRGLGPALSALAGRCTVPVTVEVDLDRRPAPAIEGIAYFTVSELLQNVAKHSGADRAAVDVWHTADQLMLMVSDNGRGGASTEAGGGLAGLAERLGSVDGLLVVDSPAGGPTTVTAELPWRG
ncbi:MULTISPECIES: sensor histidine kinase [Streptomyces]|uniref:histidine kinase n=2 Tax=Streptomyces TaxID=1883 RepID=A0A2N8P6X8_STRNR|nr:MULTISPECIES: sensor domain-containing protein [Streptomyces]PNE36769.1 histidine kinase [Streptomyces noursei]SHK97821.1 Signal transduction histidine kinase [Streptomyces yunnanensis]